MVSPEVTSRRVIFAQLLAATLLAATVRMLVIFSLPSGLNTDTDAYRRLAVTLRETGVFGFENIGADNQRLADSPVKVTAYRPPLYPLLLALLVHDGTVPPIAIGLLNVALGTATTGIVVVLANAWGLGRWSWFAALFTACDPLLVNQTAHIMTEPLAAFLAIASLTSLTYLGRVRAESWPANAKLHAAVKRVALCISCGAILGLACLARPTFLPWAMLVVGQLVISDLKSVSRWKSLALFTLGILLVVMPWGFRNLAQFGRFKITTTHGGYTLLLGNNAYFYEHLRERNATIWRSDRLDDEWTDKRSHIDEFADDQLAYKWARSAIQAEPGMFFYASAYRILRFWHVLPRRTVEHERRSITAVRYETATWYVIVYGLVAVAIIRRGREMLRTPWIWGVLLCVTFTLVHSIYWSDMRMRAPLMPFLSLVAALGIREMAEKFRAEK